jgi:hypothetical protein
MKLIKQHKVVLVILMASALSSGCQLLGPLMGMLGGGGLALDEGEEAMYMAAPDSVAQKLGYRWATSGETEKDGGFLYGAYKAK